MSSISKVTSLGQNYQPRAASSPTVVRVSEDVSMRVISQDSEGADTLARRTQEAVKKRLKYLSDNGVADPSNWSCAICLEGARDTDIIKTGCPTITSRETEQESEAHIFHISCVREQIKHNQKNKTPSNCPICRQKKALDKVVYNLDYPLHRATIDGESASLVKLVKRITNLDAQDCNQRTALHCATIAGHPPCVEVLVGAGASVDARDLNNATPLHLAAYFGNINCVTLLADGNIGARDLKEAIPLHLAAQMGHAGCLTILVKVQASRKAEHLLNARDLNKATALNIASQMGHPACVKILVDAGADVDARDLNDVTPLHWAASLGKIHSLEVLTGADADIGAIDKYQQTPIDVARQKGHTDCVKMLQDKKNERQRMSSLSRFASTHAAAAAITAYGIALHSLREGALNFHE